MCRAYSGAGWASVRSYIRLSGLETSTLVWGAGRAAGGRKEMGPLGTQIAMRFVNFVLDHVYGLCTGLETAWQ